jgi:hypothetical protein
MHNVRRISFLIIVLIIVLSVNFLFPKKSLALIGFGARILFVTPCTNGLMLTIGPFPSSGAYLLTTTPPSKIYAFYKIKPGSWTLGGYTPGGACLVPPGAPIPVIGTINMMGTSL